jgi:hypothetical protein
MKKRKKENHKFIGFHNQKEVVSVFGLDKLYAEAKCKELLLDYFHNLQDNITELLIYSKFFFLPHLHFLPYFFFFFYSYIISKVYRLIISLIF